MPAVIDRPLAWLGTISYSIYWSHYSLLIATTTTLRDVGMHTSQLWQLFLIYLPIVIAFSALTYYAIERPFLKLRVNYTRPPTPPVGVA